jgi:AraC family transcriptional regulator
MSFVGFASTSRAAGGFVLGHWVAHEGTEVAPHGHDDAHFVFITGGEFSTRAEGWGSPLIFNPRGTFHRDHFASRSGSFFTVTVPALEARVPAVPLQVGSERAMGIVMRLMREVSRWEADSDAVAEGLSLDLLATLGEPADRRPRWMARAVELVRNGGSTRDVSRAVGVHPVHFARAFREVHRCTPGDYVRALKVRRAAEMLRSSTRSLAAIALDAGFADQSHFTRVFRGIYGIAPGRFRRCFHSRPDPPAMADC